MSISSGLHSAFLHRQYTIRRKFFKVFGGAFHIYDEMNNLVLYSRQKAFRLREDFRIYTDEDMSQELLVIKTPQIIDIYATYTVFDTMTGEEVGAIKRQALRSIIKDEWTFYSKERVEIGKLTEESLGSALITRFIKLIPQRYIIFTSDGRLVSQIKQHFNPIILKYTMNIFEAEPPIDRRLIIAAGILLAGIERRQT